MVELDDDIASVWITILGNGGKRLADRILAFNLTEDSAQAIISKIPRDTEERAFQTILRNRINHGGIIAAGSGVLKHGEKGKGIRSRWYPETIAKRIWAIQDVRDKIRFIHGDAHKVISAYSSRTSACFFLDPPYTAGGKKAGSRLYTHHELNHPALFDLINGVAGDFLMTYDTSAEAASYALEHGFDVEEIPMTGTQNAKMHELLISRNLDWAR